MAIPVFINVPYNFVYTFIPLFFHSILKSHPTFTPWKGACITFLLPVHLYISSLFFITFSPTIEKLWLVRAVVVRSYICADLLSIHEGSPSKGGFPSGSTPGQLQLTEKAQSHVCTDHHVFIYTVFLKGFYIYYYYYYYLNFNDN